MDRERFRLERPEVGIALLTMCSDDGYHTMDPQFFGELADVILELDTDKGTRACIVTGTGRVFSSGGDIRTYDEMASTAVCRARVAAAFQTFNLIESVSLPVIAAVNGLAYGGGTELALACDVVIAADSARFALPEVKLGIMAGYGVIRGPEVIGRGWTHWLALSGKPIDANTALRIGLVQEVVPQDEVLSAALEFGVTVAVHAPLAVVATKEFVNRTVRAASFGEAVETTTDLFGTRDHREGVAAFRDRRQPRFEGQ